MDSKLDGHDAKGSGPTPADSKGAGRLRGGTRAISVPGAIAAVFLVAAMAFGAAAVLPESEGPGHDGEAIVIEPTDALDDTPVKDGDAGSTNGDKAEADGPKPEDEVSVEPTDKPDAEPTTKPTEKPEPKATEKAEPKPTEKPAPAPETFSLSLAHLDCGVKVAWGAFEGDGLGVYKVVRSADDHVAWPLGAKDHLVAAVGPDGDRLAKDCDAPAGRSWYRVFAVRKTADGYQVLGKSAVASIVVEKPEPTPVPDPVSLGLDIEATADGIALHWEACSSEDFVAYKVVRSMTNEQPTYPVNDGTQKVAIFENPGTTSWTDTDVAGGQTWFYRVYAIGSGGGETYVLGITPVRSATAP